MDALAQASDDSARERALAALREGSVNEIVWSHARLGQVAWLQLTPFRSVPIDVGYYGMYGVHHFSALERLRPVCGAAVEAAVGSVLTSPDVLKMTAHPTLSAGMRLFAYVTAALRTIRLAAPVVRRDPRSFAVRGWYAGRFALRHGAVRGLLRSYVAEPRLRTHVDPLELLDDILKLRLVRKAGIGPDSHLRSTLDPQTRTLVVTTQRGPATDESALATNGSGDVMHLLWDNSAFGSTVRLRGGVIATLDEEARHHFRALSEVARGDAGRMQSVLDVVIDKPDRHR